MSGVRSRREKRRNPFLCGTEEIQRTPDEILPFGRDKSAACRGGWWGKATPLREERDFTGGPAANFVVKRFRPSGSEDFIFCCREETKSVPLRNGRNPACAGRNPAVRQGEIRRLSRRVVEKNYPAPRGAGFHRRQEIEKIVRSPLFFVLFFGLCSFSVAIAGGICYNSG